LKSQRDLYPNEKYVLDKNRQPAYPVPHAISTAFRRYKNDLGLNPKAKVVHSIRAYFASLAEHKGVDPRTIQQMMGHSSMETTNIYLGRPATRIQNAMKTMNEGLDNLFKK
jgi:site-specific recombinase XerD